jgi:serine/threonine protein kinase
VAAHDRVKELLCRWDELREQGEQITPEALCADAPELVDELTAQIRRLRSMDWLDEPGGPVEEGPAVPNEQVVPPTIAGRYRLEGLIAEGGFGRVYRATDLMLQRPVAVKVTTLECVGEARRVASLRHHGIISVHDVGHEAGLCFIVFDLVEGTDLARRISEERPAWQEAVRIVAEVAGHLHHAHGKGFIHRDIKPANILLDEQGQPILADFGIAVTECELRHEVLTSTGTLAYMSPEQLTPGSQVDARTDVYSLGVVLYELLTGTIPFSDQTLTGLRRRILAEPPQPIRLRNPVVPTGVERVCMKALSKAANDRYASAREFAEALQEWR